MHKPPRFLALLCCALLLTGCGAPNSPTEPPSSAESVAATTSETTAPTSLFDIQNLQFSIPETASTMQPNDSESYVIFTEQKSILSIYVGEVPGGTDIADAYTTLQHQVMSKDDTVERLDEVSESASVAGLSATGESYSCVNERGIREHRIDLSCHDDTHAYTFNFRCNAQDDGWENYLNDFSEFIASATILDIPASNSPAPESTPSSDGHISGSGPIPSQSTRPTDAPVGTIDNPYRAGMYKVGEDIPAGEYLFLAKSSSSGYICITPDSNQSEIISNALFSGSQFATVTDGQYLEVKRCVFVPADGHAISIDDPNAIPDGMYRVGTDIPAGEYRLTSSSDSGYYCIYPSSDLPLDIETNLIFEGSAYVTVYDGQYLELSRCTGAPVSDP